MRDCNQVAVLVAITVAAWPCQWANAQGTMADVAREFRASQECKQEGRYRDALPHAQRVVEWVRKLQGTNSPNYGAALNNLAATYDSLKMFEKAEEAYVEALEVTQRVFGREHPNVATCMNNLGIVYFCIGERDKAEQLFVDALAMRRKLIPGDNIFVAESLANLAQLRWTQGRNDEAERLYTDALAMQKRLHGLQHPGVAIAMTNLAVFLDSTGRLSEAEPLYRKALEIDRAGYGDGHPAVARDLNNLATLYHAMGRYGAAEPLYRQAIQTMAARLGENHFDLALPLNNLAALLAAKGDAKAAFYVAMRARGITHKHVRGLLAFTSNRTKLLVLEGVEDWFDMFLSLVHQKLADDPEAVASAAAAVLRSKGVTVELLGQQRLAAEAGDAQVQDVLKRLNQTRQELADATFAGAGQADDVAMLEAAQDELEALLAKSSAAFAAERSQRDADAPSVAAVLPKGSALVEFVRPRTFDFAATHGQPKWKSARYLAFVIRTGDGQTARMVDLGEAERIDGAIAAFRKAVARVASPGVKVGAASQEAMAAARELYRLVFEPLKPALAGVKHVIVSPDAGLHLVPFAALCDETGSYLVEQYSISYVGSGRDLLGRTVPAPASSKPGLIVAAPDYDSAAPRSAGAGQAAGVRSQALGRVSFAPLPGTEAEAKAIGKRFADARILLGSDASEAALREVQGPKFLHIATHGFFLQTDGAARGRAGTRGFGGIAQAASSALPSVSASDNPLLRSGLALAGANRWQDARTEGRDDGILTALEATGLDLAGTDLVVLSACETGLGKVVRGEGVFGLRRAFRQAGAGAVMMSLWRVPDQETQALMERFYRRWAAGWGKAAALRRAQLDMIVELRARDGAANPFFWAGFVLAGDTDFTAQAEPRAVDVRRFVWPVCAALVVLVLLVRIRRRARA